MTAESSRYLGYELGVWLLAVTGRIVESVEVEVTEKFLLHDLRHRVSMRTAKTFYGYYKSVLHELGLKLLVVPHGDGPFGSLQFAA